MHWAGWQDNTAPMLSNVSFNQTVSWWAEQIFKDISFSTSLYCVAWWGQWTPWLQMNLAGTDECSCTKTNNKHLLYI